MPISEWLWRKGSKGPKYQRWSEHKIMSFGILSRRKALLGLVGGPLVLTMPAPTADVAHLRRDPREVRLEHYFGEKNCPAKSYAREFVQAADRHNLDWRLLPSLAFIESGGGKAYKNNNMFGWDNGDHRFRSVKDSIHKIAERLANSHYYKNKDIDAMLWTYNPIPGYRDAVKGVMEDLGPAKATRPVKLGESDFARPGRRGEGWRRR